MECHAGAIIWDGHVWWGGWLDFQGQKVTGVEDNGWRWMHGGATLHLLFGAKLQEPGVSCVWESLFFDALSHIVRVSCFLSLFIEREKARKREKVCWFSLLLSQIRILHWFESEQGCHRSDSAIRSDHLRT